MDSNTQCKLNVIKEIPRGLAVALSQKIYCLLLQHRVPREYHDRRPRINLTFRVIYPAPTT